MGGGLGFLNKKTWHPGRIQNVENVWKKEQEHLKEQTKLEDLRKQIADERAKEELELVAAAGGHKVRSDRLDWMYQGGMLAKQEAEKRQEEAMLTGKPLQQAEDTELDRGQQTVLLPTFYSEDTPASANETWARLHSDPLFAIRQQEQTARKAIVQNPVKMDHIKAEVARLQQSKSKDKAAKKAEKKASKEAKKERKRTAADMQAGLQFPSQLHSTTRQKADYVQPRDNYSRKAEPHHAPSRRDEKIYADDSQHAYKSRRVHSPERPSASDHHRSNGHLNAADIKQQDTQRNQTDHRQHRSDGNRNGTTARHSEDGWCKSSRDEDTARHSSREGTQYGLSWGDTAPEHVQDQDRRDAAELTRKRLKEAATRKLQEERDKAAQRHQRQEYKTGRLTAEEKAAKLAEMQGNAEVHDDARWQRLSDEKTKDAAEALLQANQANGSAAEFLKQAHKSLYGATGEAASLEDRVGRRKYYNDKDTERGAFKR